MKLLQQLFVMAVSCDFLHSNKHLPESTRSGQSTCLFLITLPLHIEAHIETMLTKSHSHKTRKSFRSVYATGFSRSIISRIFIASRFRQAVQPLHPSSLSHCEKIIQRSATWCNSHRNKTNRKTSNAKTPTVIGIEWWWFFADRIGSAASPEYPATRCLDLQPVPDCASNRIQDSNEMKCRDAATQLNL